MIRIGHHTLNSRVVLAPMAGVTDLPFRKLCRQYGAALTATEMLTSNTSLWNSEKNRLRRQHRHEEEPRVVQIAGSDPDLMAAAARLNVEEGAQIIDINMGCPAKKVLKKAAGSALLRDEALVGKILRTVVGAVQVPVTLKIRTGWEPEHRNGVSIARLAEDCGVQALAIHGRTRACRFTGAVEYDTIAAIKQSLSIPVFANGDIKTPQQAKFVIDYTGADGVMIGRAAQGRPWIFQEITHFLDTGKMADPLPVSHIREILLRHVTALHRFYGEFKGVLIARKHVGWYLNHIADADHFRRHFNQLTSAQDQLVQISTVFTDVATYEEKNEEKAA